MKHISSKSLFNPSMVFAAALACLASAAWAQEATTPRAPEANLSAAGGPMPTLPCCRCLGETTTLNLGTGMAPWEYNNSAAHIIQTPHAGWTTALSPAKWIQSVASPNGVTTRVPAGTYKYQLRFVVPKCLISATVQLTGRFAADNSAKLWLNGAPIAATALSKGFVSPVAFSATLQPGTHTLMIEVNNEDSVSGAVLQAQLVKRCATEGTVAVQLGNFPTTKE